MTRKRFVKLIMAKWYDRNSAVAIAYVTRWYHKEPYAVAYERIKRWNEVEYWN